MASANFLELNYSAKLLHYIALSPLCTSQGFGKTIKIWTQLVKKSLWFFGQRFFFKNLSILGIQQTNRFPFGWVTN
jgi:hypothetical protein